MTATHYTTNRGHAMTPEPPSYRPHSDLEVRDEKWTYRFYTHENGAVSVMRFSNILGIGGGSLTLSRKAAPQIAASLNALANKSHPTENGINKP
jgi:hypothetical protein